MSRYLGVSAHLYVLTQRDQKKRPSVPATLLSFETMSLDILGQEIMFPSLGWKPASPSHFPACTLLPDGVRGHCWTECQVLVIAQQALLTA